MNIDFSSLEIERPLFTFDFTYNLMRSFLRHTEDSIQSSIAAYKDNGPKVEEIEISAEEGIYQYMESYKGLDSQDVILDDIFENYFPSLQRRSALLTLVATYEHELERFCDVYAGKQNSPIKLNDLKGQGIERVNLFVKKIIGLDNSKIFPTIKKIIKLRNSCAHNDARIIEKDGQCITAIMDMINDRAIDVRQDYDQVHIGEGFLMFVLEQFDTYINEIKNVISSK